MIKINKQVAKGKISCFLERNRVVLFFHCNNSVSLTKNDKLLGLNKEQIMAPEFAPQTHNSLFFDSNKNAKNKTYRRQGFTNQNAFKSMMVKNRLAKKVFLDINAGLPPFYQNQGLTLKKMECSTASLFQGPTLLLGCSNIKMLERGVGFCAKDKGLILLGALYDRSIINNLQIKKLIANSKNNLAHLKLLSSMKSPFLRSISLIQYLLSMRSLLVQQERLISLLKVRKEQIQGAGV
jgi:hypothetical protein